MKTSFRIQSWLVLFAVAFVYANGQLLDKPKAQVGRGGDTASGCPFFGLPEYSILHGIKVYRVGCGVNPPRLLSGMKPILNSGSNRSVGTVVVRAIIDRSGNVRYPKVIRGLGTFEDAQAINTVRQWKFEPATTTMQGLKVAIQTDLEVTFP
jgi:TonB family protein